MGPEQSGNGITEVTHALQNLSTDCDTAGNKVPPSRGAGGCPAMPAGKVRALKGRAPMSSCHGRAVREHTPLPPSRGDLLRGFLNELENLPVLRNFRIPESAFQSQNSRIPESAFQFQNPPFNPRIKTPY